MPLMGGGEKPSTTASGCIMVTAMTFLVRSSADIPGPLR